MTKYRLEYIWLDGYEPVPNLRSKTKIVDFDTEPTLDELPLWNFDGSSTRGIGRTDARHGSPASARTTTSPLRDREAPDRSTRSPGFSRTCSHRQ